MLKMTVRMGVCLLLLAAGQESMAQNAVLEVEEQKINIKLPPIDLNRFFTVENVDTSYRLVLKESFLPKIVESVKKSPF